MAGEQLHPNLGKTLLHATRIWMVDKVARLRQQYLSATDITGRPIERSEEHRAGYLTALEDLLRLLN